MPPYTLDLDRRADALIDLLGCPVRWSSKYYIMTLTKRLMMICTENDRQDLHDKILAKVETTELLAECT